MRLENSGNFGQNTEAGVRGIIGVRASFVTLLGLGLGLGLVSSYYKYTKGIKEIEIRRNYTN